MGLYRKQRSKFYWMSFRVEGRRYFQSTGTSNKKLAEQIYAKTVTEIAEGKWFQNEAKRRTFEELRDRYMREHSTINKAPKSAVRDAGSFKHLARFFGGSSLATITPARISEYKSSRRQEGAKPATLNRELEVLRHAMNLAIREWEWLERTPFDRVRLERLNNKIERWLTGEEEEKLLQASPPWLQKIIIFALNSGARQDEILSLKWSEVDLTRRTATFLKTKNKEKRTIPLNQTLLGLLNEKKKVRSLSGYVFVSQNNTKIDASNLRRPFVLAREKAGIEDVRFHDLRHTFATRLVQAGMDLYKVSKLLGHKSLAMTIRYSHHFPESLRDAVEILDRNGDTLVTPDIKTGFRETPKPASLLVAGDRFELPTFGL